MKTGVPDWRSRGFAALVAILGSSPFAFSCRTSDAPAAAANAAADTGAAERDAGKRLAHSGKWRITPLGDSITGSTCGPQLLSKGLIAHGRTNFVFVGSNPNDKSCRGAPSVRSEGHGGYLVTDLVGRGPHAAELVGWSRADAADLVLMQFGTNDVWNDRSPRSILVAYDAVLAELRKANPNVILLVAQITPLNPTNCPTCESRVVALNAQIPGWAEKNSTAESPVRMVDLHSPFTAGSYLPNSTYTTDGVHPNDAGAQLIADQWFDALGALGVP